MNSLDSTSKLPIMSIPLSDVPLIEPLWEEERACISRDNVFAASKAELQVCVYECDFHPQGLPLESQNILRGLLQYAFIVIGHRNLKVLGMI